MKIELTFLTSKVARRVFTLFIACSLVPVVALGIISFWQVTNQLKEQGKTRLYQSTQALRQSILERLDFIENDLKMLSSGIPAGPGAPPQGLAEGYSARLKERFKGLALITGPEECIPLFGEIRTPGEQSAEEKQHLRSGKILILTQSSGDSSSHIYAMRAVHPQDLRRGVLCGEINSMYLWWGLTEHRTLPSMTELCILDASGKVIYSTIPDTSEKPWLKTGGSSWGWFAWNDEGEEYLASFRDIFLKPKFLYLKWTAVLSEPKGDIFKPIARFKKVFPLVILLSLWVVLFVSLIQIRRTMVPLEKLKDGTRQIALRDFESRVAITSGDEFEELGESFNDMARRLGRQFNALTTMAEIDRAILSALDTEKIVGTVITRMREFFRYDSVSVTLLDSKGGDPARTYVGSGGGNTVRKAEDSEITPHEVERLLANREIQVIQVDENLPRYLAPFVVGGIKSCVLLPLFIKQELAGIITLGLLDSSAPNQEDLHQARQLADQVAVALSNAQLIEELDLLNWGTLTALARTVDAKSPWTAGHSERVTKKALEIGQVLGLSEEQLENLHRGALLHDIGKIGIPVSILDKPGHLTDEEYRIIQQHPRMGVRILEPIAAYSDLMPIVLQHHEWFNGKGYPDGAAGDELSLGSRILAVADVFDALISDRPYRDGLGMERTIEIIKENSGGQFDPHVVQAFLKVI